MSTRQGEHRRGMCWLADTSNSHISAPDSDNRSVLYRELLANKKKFTHFCRSRARKITPTRDSDRNKHSERLKQLPRVDLLKLLRKHNKRGSAWLRDGEQRQ